jgi:hypothetical protein
LQDIVFLIISWDTTWKSTEYLWLCYNILI